MIRVPIGDVGDDDGYSSGGSMIRVPVAGHADGDDRSSSNGSVVRVDVHEDDACSSDGSVLRVPVDVGEADDGSSDGSVIRPPALEELSKDDVPRQLGHNGGTPEAPLNRLTAEALAAQGGLGHGCSEQTVAPHEGAGQGPSHAMKMNLQAAAKYFAKGGQGGASKDCGAMAATQGKGRGSGQTNGTGEGNSQVSLYDSPPPNRCRSPLAALAGFAGVKHCIHLDELPLITNCIFLLSSPDSSDLFTESPPPLSPRCTSLAGASGIERDGTARYCVCK